MSDLLNIGSSPPKVCDEKLIDIPLYGNRRIDTKTNQNILMYTFKFINDSDRFGNSLFQITCFPLELLSFLFVMILYEDVIICFPI